MEYNKKRILPAAAVGVAVIAVIVTMSRTKYAKGYDSISQEEAAEIIASGGEFTIVDVRTQKEYDDSHLLNAICVPIEVIREGDYSLLPDKDRELLLYCRTGRRAEDACKILADAGYTNVKEFGGILTWNGDIIKADSTE